MKREQLEHIIRAAGAVSGERDLVVIGSQALLAAFPDAHAGLLVSMEADLYPLNDPSKADLIDGSIGEESPFHETFGYYAHGVGPETARLPSGWKERLVRIENDNTGGTRAWCLHPGDLAVSKLLAGRDKDLAFVRELLRTGCVTAGNLRDLADELAAGERSVLLEKLDNLLRERRVSP
jgi:hypothetical protein